MKKTILFLDDDKFEMMGIYEFLISKGLLVIFCHELNQAKKELDNGLKPDLILTDLIMRSDPDESITDTHMTGIAFAKYAREKIKCPIIILTVATESRINEEAKKYIDEFISKPKTPEFIYNKIMELL